IGFIGTTFGAHGVNIAQMNVGRAQPGGEAIGVVNLDSVPPEAALEAVRAHPDVMSVSLIRLPEAGAEPPWLTPGPAAAPRPRHGPAWPPCGLHPSRVTSARPASSLRNAGGCTSSGLALQCSS